MLRSIPACVENTMRFFWGGTRVLAEIVPIYEEYCYKSRYIHAIHSTVHRLELFHVLFTDFLIGNVEHLKLLRDAFSVEASALRMIQHS